MCSAMAFIKSGGMLFATRTPMRLPTSRIAVFGQLTRLHALEIPITGADSTIQSQHGPIIMAAILGTSGCGVRIATGGILCDRQDHVALPDH